MVTDEQIRRLFMLVSKEPTKVLAAEKSGMSPNTALKYRKTGRLPSQMKQPHLWRSRPDPFVSEWAWAVELLLVNHGLEAKTIFDICNAKNPGNIKTGS